MRKKIVFSWIVVVCFLLTLMPVMAAAEPETDVQTQTAKATRIAELPEKRTAYSKAYKLSDGSFE